MQTKRPRDAASTPKPVTAKRAKKAARADRAARPRQAPIPPDVFRLLTSRLASSTSALLRLSMVCRDARDAVLGDTELWLEILRRHEVSHFQSFRHSDYGPPVIRDIPMSPYPNFKSVLGSARPIQGDPPTAEASGRSYPPYVWRIKRGQWPHMVSASKTLPFTESERQALASHALRRARILSAKTCGLCGAKHKHIPVWGLGRRVCTACLKHNLVSSAALFKEHGFDFTMHLPKILGQVFYFRYTLNMRFVLYNLSHNPVDFRKENRDSLVFFWRPHLERAVDLDAWRHEIARNREPACRLTAAVRAHHVRIVLGQRGKAHTRRTSHLFYVNAKPADTAQRLTAPDRYLIENHLPACYLVPPSCQQEWDARRALQQRFLSFRGRLTLPCVKNPVGVLERLRMLEAIREDSCLKTRVPSAESCMAMQGFRTWLDMPAYYSDWLDMPT